MNDLELLELAARAAGISGGWGDKIEYHNGAVDLRDVWILEGDDFVPWNPLTDDGDALRLVVKLSLDVCFGANYVIVRGSVQMPTVNNADDPYAATRRAIVRAAAEIGRSMDD